MEFHHGWAVSEFIGFKLICSIMKVLSRVGGLNLFLSYRGDVVQVDTSVGSSGKNGMRRNWLVRDYKTGEILTRASR